MQPDRLQETGFQPHKYSKMSWCNCGNPTCVFCASERKLFGRITLKEKTFKDIEDSYDKFYHEKDD